MSKKITMLATFILLAYLLPLAGKLHLATSPQIGLLMLFCSILFLTQPPITIRESKVKYHSDRFSVWVILAGSLITQVFSVIEWAYFKKDHNLNFDALTILALTFSSLGTVLRIWSIQTLGKYFTSTVQIQQHQQIIVKGAYSIVRHPSYLGAYIVIASTALILHSYAGFIFSLIVMFFAYYYRIKQEEAALLREFGKDYSRYQKRTKKLFPFIW